MTGKEFNSVIFFLALFYFIFFRVKVKCPQCSQETKTMTYAQFGLTWLLMRSSYIIYDLVMGSSINYYLEILFLTPAIYYLSSEPKFYCRHCMKGIPYREEYMVK